MSAVVDTEVATAATGAEHSGPDSWAAAAKQSDSSAQARRYSPARGAII